MTRSGVKGIVSKSMRGLVNEMRQPLTLHPVGNSEDFLLTDPHPGYEKDLVAVGFLRLSLDYSLYIT